MVEVKGVKDEDVFVVSCKGKGIVLKDCIDVHLFSNCSISSLEFCRRDKLVRRSLFRASFVCIVFSSGGKSLVCLFTKSVIVDREFFSVCIWLSKDCLSLMSFFFCSITLLLHIAKLGESEAELQTELVTELETEFNVGGIGEE